MPLAIDLFCGLGGWTDGLLAEDYDVIGFDIEQHVYGEHRYPGMLAIQNVLTLHGSQFRNAALIVASPPCQAYSYRAMPWKRAKALPPPDNTLFESCFRIQREACEAAGRHIPLIVENVRGAQKWVGRARWNFGSFYLWGDVPALMPITFKGSKVVGPKWDSSTQSGAYGMKRWTNPAEGFKTTGMNWSDQTKRGQDFTRIAGNQATKNTAAEGRKMRGSGDAYWREPLEELRRNATAIKNGGDWFGAGEACSLPRRSGSKSTSRKFASAMIAKIPLPLSRYIAATFRPVKYEEAAE